MRNYKDESFIAQYLSPKLIRDLKLFHIVDDDQSAEIFVNAIHDDPGYQKIREALSKQYNLGYLEPDIQVYSVDLQGDRSLTLRHTQHNRVPLGETTADVLKHLHTLWQFPVILQTIDDDNKVIAEYTCPPDLKNPPKEG
jgi:spore cortex formation protein SpoVR/YcgB (stage V sporulation)